MTEDTPGPTGEATVFDGGARQLAHFHKLLKDARWRTEGLIPEVEDKIVRATELLERAAHDQSLQECRGQGYPVANLRLSGGHCHSLPFVKLVFGGKSLVVDLPDGARRNFDHVTELVVEVPGETAVQAYQRGLEAGRAAPRDPRGQEDEFATPIPPPRKKWDVIPFRELELGARFYFHTMSGKARSIVFRKSDANAAFEPDGEKTITDPDTPVVRL